jgi:hypothetical protein
VKLPSDHNSWYNRHKTDIYLISIAAIIIALSFVIKASLDSPIPTEHLIFFLIALSIVGAVNFYPYVKELIDRNTVSDP